MNCMNCGGRLAVRRENHRYVEGGLPNVVLMNLEIRHCEACGQDEVVIPQIAQLHRFLAMEVLAKKTARLAPEEIKFLRKYLGWSGSEFASHFEVVPETISRWENGKQSMNATAERLLRLSVMCLEPQSEYPIPEKVSQSRKKPLQVQVKLKEKEWQPAVAA